jgi:predicted GIY-YIG superfamily endonuclease
MPSIFVYALRFEDGGVYVGLTKDLGRRLEEHTRKQSPSLKRFSGRFQVFYRKDFSSYREARAHEKYLKSGAGRQLLDRIRT